MNASVEEISGEALKTLIEQVSEAFVNGVPLGDLYGYDANDYEAVYALGHNFYSQARYFDALKAFAFLVMNQPLERRFNKAYASCLQMQKQYDNAISFYAMTTVMDPEDPAPTFHIAECMIAQGRLEEAADALGIVIERCETPELEPLKERAKAVLGLLKVPQSSERSETK